MPRSVVVAAVAITAITAPALAARAPSATETKALRTAVSGYIHTPHSPAASDNRIVALSVSTHDARYAAVRLDSKSAGPSDMVLHRNGAIWFVEGFGSSLGCDSAPAAVLRDLHVGCSPPVATAWIGDCGPLVSAPAMLTIACGDGNYYLTRLAWKHWGAAGATATGTAMKNDCKPYCAAGHFHSQNVTVVADELMSCGSARYYSRLRVTPGGAISFDCFGG